MKSKFDFKIGDKLKYKSPEHWCTYEVTDLVDIGHGFYHCTIKYLDSRPPVKNFLVNSEWVHTFYEKLDPTYISANE